MMGDDRAGGIVGEREGWREEVKAGQLQLLSEDLVLLLRNAGWGAGSPATNAGGGRCGSGGGGSWMMGMMVVSASTTVLADSIICLRTTSFMARATASKAAVACALSVV